MPRPALAPAPGQTVLPWPPSSPAIITFPNLAAAAAVGTYFERAHGTNSRRPGRLQSPEQPLAARAHQAGGNDLLLDAYNANPSSMAAALRSFAAAAGGRCAGSGSHPGRYV